MPERLTTEERREVRQGLIDMGFRRGAPLNWDESTHLDKGDGAYTEEWWGPGSTHIALTWRPKAHLPRPHHERSIMSEHEGSEEGGEGLSGWRGANLLAEWVESLWTTSCGHGGGYARDCTRCIHETLHGSEWLGEYVADRLAAVQAERDALMRATWSAYVESGADTDGDEKWHCTPEWAGKALMHAVETLRKDYDDSFDESTAAESARDTALREKADLEARLDDLTRRLGFGPGYQEPQADNDTIVAWFEQQSRDANEWQESQLWRNDCYAAGHPDDEDCAEHDPTLRLLTVEARLAAVEALADEWTECGDGWTDAARFLRAALANPSAAQREAEVGARAKTVVISPIEWVELLAEAWDKGHRLTAPHSDQCEPTCPNPYRADALTTDEAEVPR